MHNIMISMHASSMVCKVCNVYCQSSFYFTYSRIAMINDLLSFGGKYKKVEMNEDACL